MFDSTYANRKNISNHACLMKLNGLKEHYYNEIAQKTPKLSLYSHLIAYGEI